MKTTTGNEEKEKIQKEYDDHLEKADESYKQKENDKQWSFVAHSTVAFATFDLQHASQHLFFTVDYRFTSVLAGHTI